MGNTEFFKVVPIRGGVVVFSSDDIKLCIILCDERQNRCLIRMVTDILVTDRILEQLYVLMQMLQEKREHFIEKDNELIFQDTTESLDDINTHFQSLDEDDLEEARRNGEVH